LSARRIRAAKKENPKRWGIFMSFFLKRAGPFNTERKTGKLKMRGARGKIAVG